MEAYLSYFAVVFTIAIVLNLIMQFIDMRTKQYTYYLLEEMLEGGKPQNILISEGQARGIAKLVKQLLDEEKPKGE